MPRILPSDIPKFDGKLGEDPKNHVMTSNCWCCSNSLMDDSIRLCLFKWTLTGTKSKLYIELPTIFFSNYGTLAMAFLTHFQFPIHYETSTKILTSLRISNSTHISNHIHEWYKRRRLIKAQILDQLLEDWLTKSRFPPIARDVAMGVLLLRNKPSFAPNT